MPLPGQSVSLNPLIGGRLLGFSRLQVGRIDLSSRAFGRYMELSAVWTPERRRVCRSHNGVAGAAGQLASPTRGGQQGWSCTGDPGDWTAEAR